MSRPNPQQEFEKKYPGTKVLCDGPISDDDLKLQLQFCEEYAQETPEVARALATNSLPSIPPSVYFGGGNKDTEKRINKDIPRMVRTIPQFSGGIIQVVNVKQPGLTPWTTIKNWTEGKLIKQITENPEDSGKTSQEKNELLNDRWDYCWPEIVREIMLHRGCRKRRHEN